MAFVVSSTSPVHATLNVPVLLFTLAVTLAAAISFGVAPAIQASRIDLVTAIKSRSLRGGMSRGRSRGAAALVALQIAMSLVLLVGAGLFGRSLINLVSHPLGFEPGPVVLARLNPRLAGHTPSSAIALYRTLYERVSVMPGVASVTFARYSPFGGGRSVNTGVVEGYAPAPDENIKIEAIHVGPSYPQTLGIPIVAGRALDIRDVEGAPRVGMVNETFVRKYLTNVNPIGRHFGLDDEKPADIEIVGVLKDAQFHDAREAVSPMAFVSFYQDPNQFTLDGELELRAAGDPAALTGLVRRLVAEVDPESADRRSAPAARTGVARVRQPAARRAVREPFRTARIDACVDRPLRHDRAERRAAHQRDWRPHGARRRARAGRLDDPASDRCAALHRPRCRPARREPRRAPRRQSAVRPARAGHLLVRARRRRVARRRPRRRPGPRPPRDAGQSDSGVTV